MNAAFPMPQRTYLTRALQNQGPARLFTLRFVQTGLCQSCSQVTLIFLFNSVHFDSVPQEVAGAQHMPVRDAGRGPALSGFAEVGTWATMGGKGKDHEITEGALSMYFLVLFSRVSCATVSRPFLSVTWPGGAGVIQFWVCRTRCSRPLPRLLQSRGSSPDTEEGLNRGR